MNTRSAVKKVIPRKTFKKIEPYGHLGEAVLFNVKNRFPAKGLNVIGVTGTNGKTTTCFLVHKMLTEAGYRTGLMTTVAYGVGDDIHPQMAHMTTVAVPQLHKRIKQMRQQGMEWLVLETTSHALAQNRVWGIPYSVAVMTNITHEHLAYHGTFAKYLAAKVKLFEQADRNQKGLRVGIVNAEDENAKAFTGAIANHVSYGVEKGDLKATKLKLTAGGSRYMAKIGEDEYKIECHLPGKFNVYNSLAAIAVGRAVGLTKKQIEKGIAALKSVEGRMTRVDEGQDFDVIVDYAHSPDSFEKLFSDMRPVVKGKLIVLFGSLGTGGDVSKRAEQGKLAGKYADEVIVTEEDDRQDDGMKIMDQIAEGAESAGKLRDKDLFLIHDRTKAIQFAIGRARKNDTVMLLGKGHEKTVERNEGTFPWNETEVAKKALKERKTN